MKLLAILLLVLSLAVPSLAGDVSMKVGWNQVLPADGLKEGRMYISDKTGGPYTLFLSIPFVAAQSEYTASASLTSPDGVKRAYFFVLTAVSKEGVESKYSNEASKVVDFEAPGAPVIINLTIELKTVVR